MQQDRQHRAVRGASPSWSSLARAMPSTTGLTASRWRRVGRDRRLDRLAAGRGELALGAEVVLHVAGALRLARVDVALELAEDLAVALADDVGQHVEPAAVRHADDDLVEAGVGGLLADLVEEHDRRLAALEARTASGRRTWSAGRSRRSRPRSACPGSAGAPRAASGSNGRSNRSWIQVRCSLSGCACTRRRRCGSRSRAACARMSRSVIDLAGRGRRSVPTGNSRSRSHRVRPWYSTAPGRGGCAGGTPAGRCRP